MFSHLLFFQGDRWKNEPIIASFHIRSRKTGLKLQKGKIDELLERGYQLKTKNVHSEKTGNDYNYAYLRKGKRSHSLGRVDELDPDILSMLNDKPSSLTSPSKPSSQSFSLLNTSGRQRPSSANALMGQMVSRIRNEMDTLEYEAANNPDKAVRYAWDVVRVREPEPWAQFKLLAKPTWASELREELLHNPFQERVRMAVITEQQVPTMREHLVQLIT